MRRDNIFSYLCEFSGRLRKKSGSGSAVNAVGEIRREKTREEKRYTESIKTRRLFLLFFSSYATIKA